LKTLSEFNFLSYYPLPFASDMYDYTASLEKIKPYLHKF